MRLPVALGCDAREFGRGNRHSVALNPDLFQSVGNSDPEVVEQCLELVLAHMGMRLDEFLLRLQGGALGQLLLEKLDGSSERADFVLTRPVGHFARKIAIGDLEHALCELLER